MKEFCVATLFCLLLHVLQTLCILAERNENMLARPHFERYLRNRVRDFIVLHSKNLENETRKSSDFSIKTDSHVVTGSALAHERTRLFANIIASTRDSRENKFLYNTGIRFLGVENFLSTAVQFCETEAQGGKIDIVSIGSGDGYVENRIRVAYRECVANPSPLNLILVDPNERYRPEVDYRYVDEVIDENPRIVGNCVLFIFCPPPAAANDGYDIDSIRKLKPKAVLSEYEATGVSGSRALVEFLDPDGGYDEERCKKHGLDYYPIKEIALQVKWRGTDVRLIKVLKNRRK